MKVRDAGVTRATAIARIPTPRRTAPVSPIGVGKHITLVTHPGLGDYVAALPVAYAFAEAGYSPSVAMHDPDRYSFGVTSPAMKDVPGLPLTTAQQNGDHRILTDCYGFQWCDDHSMVDSLCRDLGVSIVSTPRTACLLKSEEQREVAEAFVGEGHYAVIAPRGRVWADEKAMSDAQIAAIIEAAGEHDCRAVVVGHDGDWQPPKGCINLLGETTIADLFALIAHATVVYSTDTGALHIAGAYNTPCIGIVPERTSPRAMMRHYAPLLWLEGAGGSANVALADIAKYTHRMFDVLGREWSVVGPARKACGIPVVGRAMAKACGVKYVPFEKHDGGWCVAEYLCTDLEGPLGYLDPEKTVLSAHTVAGEECGRFAAVMFRGVGQYRKFSGKCRRVWQVPLQGIEPLEGLRLPERPRKVFWHGFCNANKGLRELCTAFARLRGMIPDAELHIVGSTGNPSVTDEAVGYLQAVQEKQAGLTLELKPFWTDAELKRRMKAADLFCYLDTVDAEQSACTPIVLGYGKPVVISESTKHDDVRGWGVTAKKGEEAQVLAGLMTDRRLYADAATRATLGATYRTPTIIARQYEAIMRQAMLDEEMRLMGSDNARTWDQYYEQRGPIAETVIPFEHTCPEPSGGGGDDCPVEVGELHRLWDVVGPLVRNRQGILDMGGTGGGDPAGLPWATNWDLQEGHDMRDVSMLMKAHAKFELIISSHSIEHIPPEDVPAMLKSWLPLLAEDGELFISGPHRCSECWSPLYHEVGWCSHLWAPTASAVGNFLCDEGLELVDYCDHDCRANAWWVRLRKHGALKRPGEWLFIIGPGRSFTTPTELMLNAHPDCHIVHEGYLVPKVAAAAAVGGATTLKLSCGEHHYSLDHQPEAIHWSPPANALNCLDGEQRKALAREGCEFAKAHFPQVRVFGDKCPWVPWRDIADVIPEAKFVVLSRPIDDIMASQERWAVSDKRGQGTLRTREQVEECLKDGEDCLRSANSMGFSKAQFEQDPEGAISDLLTFAGLDIEQYPMDETIERLTHGEHIS